MKNNFFAFCLTKEEILIPEYDPWRTSHLTLLKKVYSKKKKKRLFLKFEKKKKLDLQIKISNLKNTPFVPSLFHKYFTFHNDLTW